MDMYDHGYSHQALFDLQKKVTFAKGWSDGCIHIIHIGVLNKSYSHPLRRSRASQLCRPARPVLRSTGREAVSFIHLCRYPGRAFGLLASGNLQSRVKGRLGGSEIRRRIYEASGRPHVYSHLHFLPLDLNPPYLSIMGSSMNDRLSHSPRREFISALRN